MFGFLLYCMAIVLICAGVVESIITLTLYIGRKADKNDKYSLGTSHKEWL